MGMRIGHGYDVHRLAKGRRLILGGTVIPYEKGSSAIRTPTFWRTRPLTPFSARRRSGTSVLSSLILTRSIGAQTASGCSQVADRVRQAGYAVSNLDATVLAQAPKLAPLCPTDAGASGGGLRCRARAGQRQGDDRGRARLHRHRGGHRRPRGLPAGTAAFGRRFRSGRDGIV